MLTKKEPRDAAERGTLRVLLKRGTGFSNSKHSEAEVNPFVVVHLGTNKRKSKVVKDTCDPEWNERFEFSGLTFGEVTKVPLLLHAYILLVQANVE